VYAPIASPVLVEIEDAHGNLVPIGNDRVTLSITSDSAGAVPPGPFTATAVNGVASFSGFTFDDAGTYTVRATDGSITSAAFTVSVEAPPGLRLYLFSGAPLSQAAIQYEERRLGAQLAAPSSPAVSASAPTASAAISANAFQSSTAVDPNLPPDTDTAIIQPDQMSQTSVESLTNLLDEN